MSSMTGSGSLATSFLGALQASVSVLLTIFYGVLAAQFELVQGSSTENISRLCVTMLMPALLITSLGEELNVGTLLNYVQIAGVALTSLRIVETTKY
jgi:auxin efflux carrier family protein